MGRAQIGHRSQVHTRRANLASPLPPNPESDRISRVAASTSTAATRLANAGGSVLAGATHILGTVRSAPKPLHPTGELYAGRLDRRGAGAGPLTGVAWIDHPGSDQVEARVSRAVGLPAPLPDIHGLAIRISGDGGPADLLFAGTGTRWITRFLLVPSRDSRRPMTTLLPYRTATGPVLLRVDNTGADTYELSWARHRGPWHGFATLRLLEPHGDPQVSFDPVVNQLPCLDQYPAILRLREPAYARARRTRDEVCLR